MILVTYTGYTTGTLGGRDDGYPETKVVICNHLIDVARLATRKDFKAYIVTEATPFLLERASVAVHKHEEAQRAASRRDKLHQIKKLQRELDSEE